MTSIEISKALALAIGYLPEHVKTYTNGVMVYRPYSALMLAHPTAYEHGWYSFSAEDWAVIGPIGERYNCFPKKHGKVWIAHCGRSSVGGGSPQEVIAKAVISGVGND